tara:strand:+ start:247 stop:708 length:462 start_codon:yes stop_codon:yes gene_type:complete
MKPINIHLVKQNPYRVQARINSNEKIVAALLEVNGRAGSHTFTRAYEIHEAGQEASDYLEDLGLSKARMIGAKVSFVSGGEVPNAYKWKRKVTAVQIERRQSGWFLNSIESIEIWGNARKPVYLLTSQQDDILVAKLRSAYLVIPPVVEAQAS